MTIYEFASNHPFIFTFIVIFLLVIVFATIVEILENYMPKSKITKFFKKVLDLSEWDVKP